MDATQKIFRIPLHVPVVSLALAMAAAAWSQPTLKPSPSAVTLNNSTNTSADIAITSDGDPITFSSSVTYVTPGPQWLQVQSSSGVTPAYLQLGLRTAGLSAGVYTATVNLTPSAPTGATGATINVTLNFGVGGGGGSGTTITASPSTVNVAAAVGGSAYATPSPTISTSSPTSITLNSGSTSVNTSVPWLTAQLNTTTIVSGSPATLTLFANGAGLAAGTQQGTVTIVPDTGSAVTITVNFTTGGSGGSGLVANPTPISWAFTTNSGGYPSQTVTLSSGAGATTFVANSDAPWLVLNGNTHLEGNIGDALTVYVGNQANTLTAGAYSGHVVFSDNLGNQATITVNLAVNSGSTGLTLTPPTLNISVPIGGQPQQASLTVNSVDGGPFSVSKSAPWMTVSASATSLGPNGAGTVQVTVNPGNMPDGTYTDIVTVTVGSETKAAQVAMVVGTGGGSGATSGIVAPDTVTMNLQLGASTTAITGSTLEISGATGNWSSTISYAGSATGWLSLSAANGTFLPAQTKLLVDPTKLTALGTYNATIRFTTPNGVQDVTVSVVMNSGAVLLSTPASVVFDDQSGFGPQSVFFRSSDNTPFDLSGAVTSNAPWISIAPISVGNTTLGVSVDRAGLSGGLYSSSITVAKAGFPSLTLPIVLLTGAGGSNGALNFSPSVLTFSAPFGGNPAQQVLSITGNLQTSFSISTSTSSGGSWLGVGQTSGSTPMNLTVTVNSSGLAPGIYTGSINFGTGQSVGVTLTVSTSSGGGNTGNVTVTPSAGLTFTAQTGSGNLTAQTLHIASASGNSEVNFTVQATTDSGGSWLSTSVNPGVSITTPLDLTVNAKATGLAAGDYTGKITITPSGGNAVNVPIKLTITAPPSVSASPASLTFNYRRGAAAPAAQQVTVSGNGAALAFTATASSTGNWLQVSPATGTTPATINASVDSSGLSAGTYDGSIKVAGSGGAPGSTTIPVTLTVTNPLPTISQVTNGASFASGSISPGEIITVFGTDLGPATPARLADAPNGQVGTTLGGTQVTIGGFPAPMIYASGTQVSAVVPYEVAQLASANVVVKFLDSASNGFAANVSTTAPGIFTQKATGTGAGAILNQNGTVNSVSNPAARGETIVVYLTGEGQTSPAGVTGKVTVVNEAPPLTPAPLLPVSVLIGGQPAAGISFTGEAPGFVSGLMQLNVVVPTNIAAGDQPIVVSIGGQSSQNGVIVSLK